MRVWYDISGLYTWKGSFTGIQRVVYNLGRNLGAEDIEARFFVFQHGIFREVSFTELKNGVDPDVGSSEVSIKRPERQSARAILQHHGVMAAKQVVIGSRMERPLRKVYRGARKTYRTVRAGNMPATIAAMPAIFAAGDIVVVVDGNWQFPGFAPAVIAAKSKMDFKLVHFVHDLVAVKNPALASEQADKIIGGYFEKLLPHTDRILAVSESTKNDVIWFAKKRSLNIPSIDVVKLGSDIQQGERLTMKRPKLGFSGEFILSVSTIEVRKNYLLLYYVYKEAISRHIELPQLVIVGRKGWMAEDTYNLLTRDPEIQSYVTLLAGIPDGELEWLYQNCLFTIFPSFYEGWGLPIAESFAHGKACISSDASSMPEVGGDMAAYISPYNPAEAINAIQSYMDDSTRMKVELRIRDTYKPTSWHDAQEIFMGVLRNLN